MLEVDDVLEVSEEDEVESDESVEEDDEPEELVDVESEVESDESDESDEDDEDVEVESDESVDELSESDELLDFFDFLDFFDDLLRLPSSVLPMHVDGTGSVKYAFWRFTSALCRSSMFMDEMMSDLRFSVAGVSAPLMPTLTTLEKRTYCFFLR